MDHLGRARALGVVLIALTAAGPLLLAARHALPETPARAQAALRWHAPGLDPPGAEPAPILPAALSPGLDRLAPPPRALVLGPLPGEPAR